MTDIVEIEIGGKVWKLKFGLIALKKVTEKVPFAMIQEKPVHFILEYSYQALLSRRKDNQLPKGFSQNDFEEWFDDLEMNQVREISETMQFSMNELGKMIAPQQEEVEETPEEQEETKEEEMTKD